MQNPMSGEKPERRGDASGAVELNEGRDPRIAAGRRKYTKLAMTQARSTKKMIVEYCGNRNWSRTAASRTARLTKGTTLRTRTATAGRSRVPRYLGFVPNERYGVSPAI